MSTINKKGNAPKMMKVAPNVTDPSMQNNRTHTDMLLAAEMGENNNDIQETVFNSKNRTQEEQTNHGSSDNTILMIIFALIVVALVAIIVWIIMKQGNDKKDEEFIRQKIHPNQRNNMPNMQTAKLQGTRHYPDPNTAIPMPGRTHQNQQSDLIEEDDTTEEPTHREKPAKSFVEAMSKSSKKAAAAKAAKNEKEDLYDNKHPHPSIMRPNKDSDEQNESDAESEEDQPKIVQKTSRTRHRKRTSQNSDVDDVMKKTAALLSESNEMTEEDKAILDKATEEAEMSD